MAKFRAEESGRSSARAAAAALGALGFDAVKQVQAEFPVWIGKGRVVRADAVGFTHAPFDMSTATIVSETRSELGAQPLEVARALEAPAVILVAGDMVRPYLVGARAAEAMSDWISPDDLSGRVRARLAPAALFEQKVRGRQLAIFAADVGSATGTSNHLGRELLDRVTQTATALDESLKPTLTPTADRGVSARADRSSRLLVGALACLVMRDKSGDALPEATLPDVALQRYPNYFSWYAEFTASEQDLFLGVLRELGDGLTFRGLSATLLSNVFEEALATLGNRRGEATYYTPPDLARYLLANLPIEDLPPDQRTVLDPSCGAGSLLLAAAQRLEDLYGPEGGEVPRGYVPGLLTGWDANAMAVQVTSLALLMRDLRASEEWRVTRRDVLVEEAGLAPEGGVAICVSNPPWGSQPDGDRRGQRADRFLEHAMRLTRPDGLLGVLLPATWLTSQQSSASRRSLREHCEVLEIWRLPEGAFPTAHVSTAVVFARRRRCTPGGVVAFRRVWPGAENIRRFLLTGLPDESYVTTADASLGTGTVSDTIERAHVGRLSDLATVREGAVPLSNSRKVLRGWREQEPNQLFLARQALLPALGEAAAVDLVPTSFPNDFAWNTQERQATARKVLVGATRNTQQPWRLKVGLDLRGVVASNLFHLITPDAARVGLSGEDSLLAVMALLASAVASLWVDERAASRWIPTGVLAGLPIPADLDWTYLAQLGAGLTNAREADKGRLLARLSELDTFVWDSYQLPDDVRAIGVRRLAGRKAPDGLVRYPASRPAQEHLTGAAGAATDSSAWWATGATLAASPGLVTLWVADVTGSEGQTMRMPLGMPGALAQPGATFEVFASGVNDLRTAAYRGHRAAWLPDDELFGQTAS